MGLSMDDIQRQNFEKAVSFIQDQHAKTLKDLHEEIRKLQARCSELTFENAMQSTYEVDEGQYTRQIDTLEQELRSTRQRNSQLQTSVDASSHEKDELHKRLLGFERQKENEQKGLRKELSGLRKELESRSSTIARLTAQLHQIKQRQAAVTSAAAEGTYHPPPEMGRLATPPSATVDGGDGSVVKSRGRRRTYRPVSAGSVNSASSGSPREDPRLDVSVGDSSQLTSLQRAPARLRVGRQSVEQAISQDPNLPDPRPFIQRRFKPTPPRVEMKPKKTPLPPIKPPGGDLTSGRDSAEPDLEEVLEGGPQPPPRRVSSRQLHLFTHTPSPKASGSRTSTVEVEKLAVDQTAKSRCDYRSTEQRGHQ